MAKYALGKHALAECDVCGSRTLYRHLKAVIVKGKPSGSKACPECWDPDHPQLHINEVRVDDPQALRDPRPDTGLAASRVHQWGWNPVGGGDGVFTPNDLVGHGSVGRVTITIT